MARLFYDHDVRFSVVHIALAVALVGLGCSPIAQNRRQFLADPTMQLTDDPLEAQAMRKMHGAREGAAGGDANAAGGGCGCGN